MSSIVTKKNSAMCMTSKDECTPKPSYMNTITACGLVTTLRDGGSHRLLTWNPPLPVIAMCTIFGDVPLHFRRYPLKRERECYPLAWNQSPPRHSQTSRATCDVAQHDRYNRVLRLRRCECRQLALRPVRPAGAECNAFDLGGSLVVKTVEKG